MDATLKKMATVSIFHEHPALSHKIAWRELLPEGNSGWLQRS